MSVQSDWIDGTRKVSLGIDPGWNNLGMATVVPVDKIEDGRFKVEIVSSGSYNVSENPERFVENLPFKYVGFASDVTIERYVSYANVRSGESENITMLIGMLRMRYHLLQLVPDDKINIRLIRAIEWKTKLAQTLSRYCEFNNPSLDLDKKFSMAAAKFIVVNPNEIKNDHIADSVCLASLPLLERYICKTK